MDFLKITFKLKNGIYSPKNPINLDALIAYCLVQEEKPSNDQEMDELHDNLPIAKYETEDWSVWKASRLILIPLFSEARMLTSGVNEEHSLGLASKGLFYTGRKGGLKIILTGEYKNFQVFYQVDTLKDCYGFVHGDKKRIEKLLKKHLSHLGAKSSLGSGQIKQIIIEEIDEKDCAWHFRSMPINNSFHSKGVTKVARIKPPYWKKKDEILSITPIYFDPR